MPMTHSTVSGSLVYTTSSMVVPWAVMCLVSVVSFSSSMAAGRLCGFVAADEERPRKMMQMGAVQKEWGRYFVVPKG